ncbi:hypothetical protein [Actinoplanes sp. NPDC026623]|uniref:hypothetical protein n=1 Tax=Actinoplanes sp. NPDC026623 TaxID=3155610 RepID=UPI0033FB8EC5
MATDGRVGCMVVTGAEADRLREAAAHASVLTPWRSGDKAWDITFRPLLPDESRCTDLAEFDHARHVDRCRPGPRGGRLVDRLKR